MNDRTTPGMLVILSGPSGSGKTTMCSRLVSEMHAERSVSATTRPRRKKEMNGRDYWFLDRDAFLREAQDGGFAEHAEYCGHLYGTPLKPLQEAIVEGRMLFLVIEVQGAQQIREQFPDAVSIFIKPPTSEEAARRLDARNQDSTEEIALRREQAEIELERAKEYDYVVVNDHLDTALAEVKEILTAERAKRSQASSD